MRIEHKNYDEERALYGLREAEIAHCTFAGPADGESAFKEAGQLRVSDCTFQLRYPFWHTDDSVIERCTMTETCRAALWYDRAITIRNSTLHGTKALRECDDSTLEDCDIISAEFGWRCRGVSLCRTTLESEYPFFLTQNLTADAFTLKGKYSFQYVENAVIRNSELNTKDAFWHAKNVRVEDSVVRGEYLGWYSENLHLIRCRIIGTQPLCYCKGLVLEDCTMEETDLAFENSDVTATVRGTILSVKNPAGGRIEADGIGEIIRDEFARGEAEIVLRV